MKVKLSTILDAQTALGEFAQKDLKIATAYKVAKLIKAISAEIELFNEQRIKLLQSVGSTLSEDGKRYIIPENKKAEFAEGFTELVAVEVDIPERLDLSDEEIRLSPAAVLDLEPFIILETE